MTACESERSSSTQFQIMSYYPEQDVLGRKPTWDDAARHTR